MVEEGECCKSLLTIRGTWVLTLNNVENLWKVLSKQVASLYFRRIFLTAL